MIAKGSSFKRITAVLIDVVAREMLADDAGNRQVDEDIAAALRRLGL